MKTTPAMRAAFVEAYANCSNSAMDALEAALADVPEPVPGPFTVSEDERGALMVLIQDATARNDIKEANTVAAMFARAVRTLAAPAVDPLSLQEERLVQDFERLTMAEQGSGFSLLPILRKRFPKPEPASKTARELGNITTRYPNLRPEEREAIAELVRRAEAGEP